MPRALEQIRRMRGGAQAHLMRCQGDTPEEFYVVKFQNNPQAARGGRILCNEFLGTRLAARLGLPTQPPAVVEVSSELIRYTADLVMQIGTGAVPCTPGPQFGSRFPGHPGAIAVHDFLPDEKLAEVENLSDFAGMLVLDKLLCNTNGRQAIFYRDSDHASYRAVFVDQGFCCNAGEWNFPDAPLRGIYPKHRVYASVTGTESFAPWLDRVERMITPSLLDEITSEIPPVWYDEDQEGLYDLLEHIYRRRRKVPDLILEARKSSRQPFVNWR
jgi:hypothetical protein